MNVLLRCDCIMIIMYYDLSLQFMIFIAVHIHASCLVVSDHHMCLSVCMGLLEIVRE